MTIPTAVRLGDLTEPVASWNPTRAPDGQFDYIDLSSIDQDRKLVSTATRLRTTDAPSRARQLVSPGDVLVSTVRPNLNGVAVVPDALESATASTGFSVLRPGNRLEGRYLFHWARSPRFIHDMVRSATGASYPAVSDKIVKASAIPLPPLDEQRRIAAILDQADALRAKRRAALTSLDDLTQSIFLDMFGDPSPNPMGWPTARLGGLSRVIRGASPRPAGDPRYFGGSIPWLKITDVTAARGRFVETIKESVTAAGRDKSVFLDAGTLILTNSATVGVPKILGIPSCIHDGFIAFLDLEPGLEQTYLYATLQALRQTLIRMAPEGTQKNLNTPIVKALMLPLPPLELQRVFAERLVRAEQLSDRQRAHQTELDSLFSSLQSRAFEGVL